MAEKTLLDTGPLVAFLDADEEHHDWAVACFQELEPKFLTCEAVLTLDRDFLVYRKYGNRTIPTIMPASR